MKKIFVLVLTLCLAVVLCASALADTKMLKVSHVFAEGHPVYQAFQEAADLLQEKTECRYGLTVYPAGTYANYNDSITAVQMGDLDIAALDSATDWLEAAGVLFAPYCSRSSSVCDRGIMVYYNPPSGGLSTFFRFTPVPGSRPRSPRER